jgi:hypothetical protein
MALFLKLKTLRIDKLRFMKHIILIIICLLLFLVSHSQEDWKKSWCVTHTGDTLHGNVLFGDWDVSPTMIRFRDSINSVQRTFYANEIRRLAIFLNNKIEFYEGKTTSVKQYFSTPIPIGTNPVFQVDTVTCFLEILFESEVVNLYRMLTKDKEPRFYLQKESLLIELDYAKIQIINNSKISNREIDKYKFQLKAVLWECPTIQVANLRYDEKSLLKILREYHSYCKVDYKVLFENENRPIFNLGGMGGVLFWQGFEPVFSYNVSLRYLAPKRFNNRFVIAEFGQLYSKNRDFRDGKDTQINFALYAGTYFGKRDFRPLAFTGYSRMLGLFDTGVGVTYKKKFDFYVHSSAGAIAYQAFEFSFRYYPTYKGL